MNKKQYEAMRKKLMDEAEGLINEGKIKGCDCAGTGEFQSTE